MSTSEVTIESPPGQQIVRQTQAPSGPAVTVIEPPLWKAWTASLVAGGAWWCWSLPKGEFAEASLRSWLAVVGHVVQGAAKHLAQRLARGGAALRPLDPDVLAWW